MKHILFKDESLQGWEYGMLRSFEKAIVNTTKAGIVTIPEYQDKWKLVDHFGHSMNRGKYRRYFPQQRFEVEGADVAWYILMGPENYKLDLFSNWSEQCKTKIVYLYDTLPHQYPIIRRLFSDNKWDILITSFNDAVDDLNKLTGRKWHTIEQAFDKDIFRKVRFEDKKIHFSSYGRRLPHFHECLRKFAQSNGLYYDYTTHDAKHPTAPPEELYEQYAWHLSNSIFTISWPVEVTNQARAGHLSPITCRWFEAAGAGTIILGKKPQNLMFDRSLCDDLVVNVDIHPDTNTKHVYSILEQVWDKRTLFNKKATEKQQIYSTGWTWEERVKQILSIL